MSVIHPALSLIAEVVDLIGILLCLLGAAKFLVAYLRIEVSRLRARDCTQAIQSARRDLGGYILVALELLIVSDVIGSVVSQSLESLGYLAGIVVLRTAIGYFLEQELAAEREAPERA